MSTKKRACHTCLELIATGRTGKAKPEVVQHFVEHTAQSMADQIVEQADAIARGAVGGRTMLGADIWRAVGRKLS